MQAGTLDRRITLLEPGPETRSPRGGVRKGEPVPHKVWASRLDRGGGERLQASAVVGSWSTRFRVRWSRAIRDISHKWDLTDENGRAYDIERVAEIGRRVGFDIYGVART